MTADEARRTAIDYWLEKSSEALESAKAELAADRCSFAVNRVYYACFYATSAVLLAEGEKFVKHSGVRGALHRSLVRTGRLPRELGRFYDRIFENRQRGDYQELVIFEAEQVTSMVDEGKKFVEEMRRLLRTASGRAPLG